MPVEQLRDLQLERMKKTVQHSYDNVAFYQRSFKEAGVEPGRLKPLEDLPKFPFVVKQDMRDAYPFGGGLHCSTADVYREGECLDYFPNRVADPTLVRPEMWND